MRAPADDRRDLDEIIADIMELMDCPDVPPTVREVLRDCTRRLIDDLRATSSTFPGTFTGVETENVEYAEEVRDLVDKLRRKLTTRPESRFLNERFWSLGNTQGDTIEFNPQTRKYIAQDMRLTFLVQGLDWLRVQCERIKEFEIGEHASVQPELRHAASAARMMVQEATNLADIKLRSTDFYRLASLFYEATTGKGGADMRWACQAILRVKS
jgi:hypothetical protein